MAQKKVVSAEDFILAWQRAESIEEVMKVLEMTKSQAYQRARTYKENHQIPLKEMPTSPRNRKLDVEKLKDLASKCLTQQEQ